MKYILLLITIGLLSGGIFLKNSTDRSTTARKSDTVVRTQNTIYIKDYKYIPKVLKIKKGTMVTFINDDIAKHTVTVDGYDKGKAGPSSDYYGKGNKYEYTFKVVGEFSYHCEPHPYMKAKIIVE